MSISIILPVFNAEKYISETIESILFQSYPFFELIIINDGSTDRTKEIIINYEKKDKRIKIINQTNQGMAASLNYGMLISKYDFVARIDADDIMDRYRLEKQIEYMNRHPEVAVVATYVKYIDSTGKLIGSGKTDFLSTSNIVHKIKNNSLVGFNHPTVMMRKKIILEIGGYRGEYWPADDIDLWNRLLEQGYRIDIIPEYLTYYRIHEDSITIFKIKETFLKTAFVKYNLVRRRRGEKEVSYKDFLLYFDNVNFLQKINNYRKLYGQVFYKKAVFYWSSKKIIKFFMNLFLSLFLYPKYCLGKLSKKI